MDSNTRKEIVDLSRILDKANGIKERYEEFKKSPYRVSYCISLTHKDNAIGDCIVKSLDKLIEELDEKIEKTIDGQRKID